MFFHLFLRVIAPLDRSLGDLMPALYEKRLRELHEGEVQLALRPSEIGEVDVDNKYFHLVRWVKAGKAHARGGECAKASAPFGFATLIRGTPFGGRFALPRAERAVERIRILVTDEKCSFGDFDRRIA